jgi:hypothetical protein
MALGFDVYEVRVQVDDLLRPTPSACSTWGTLYPLVLRNRWPLLMGMVSIPAWATTSSDCICKGSRQLQFRLASLEQLQGISFFSHSCQNSRHQSESGAHFFDDTHNSPGSLDIVITSVAPTVGWLCVCRRTTWFSYMDNAWAWTRTTWSFAATK